MPESPLGKLAYLVLHTKFTLALGAATEGARIAEHVIQSHLSDSGEFILADFAVNNGTTPLIDTTNNIA